MRHHCHAIGCEVSTPPRLLMCSYHWARVPVPLRARVLSHFDPAQCRPASGRRPSPEWLDAAKAAIASVAEAEGRRHPYRSWASKPGLEPGWVVDGDPSKVTP